MATQIQTWGFVPKSGFRSGQRVTVATGSLAGERGEIVDHDAQYVWVDFGDDEPLIFRHGEVR